MARVASSEHELMRGRLHDRPGRRAGVRCSRWRFHCMVRQACDRLPPRFQRLLSNVAVIVEDLPSDGDALGYYEGTPLGERGSGYSIALPDKISIYRLPLLEVCRSRAELQVEIDLTVLHEIGHHFGMEDEDIPF